MCFVCTDFERSWSGTKKQIDDTTKVRMKKEMKHMNERHTPFWQTLQYVTELKFNKGKENLENGAQFVWPPLPIPKHTTFSLTCWCLLLYDRNSQHLDLVVFSVFAEMDYFSIVSLNLAALLSGLDLIRIICIFGIILFVVYTLHYFLTGPAKPILIHANTPFHSEIISKCNSLTRTYWPSYLLFTQHVSTIFGISRLRPKIHWTRWADINISYYIVFH